MVESPSTCGSELTMMEHDDKASNGRGRVVWHDSNSTGSEGKRSGFKCWVTASSVTWNQATHPFGLRRIMVASSLELRFDAK